MKSIDHNSLLPQNDKGRNHFRKGAVVIIPLVCLILTLAIIGELLKQTSIELNQLKKITAQFTGDLAIRGCGTAHSKQT